MCPAQLPGPARPASTCLACWEQMEQALERRPQATDGTAQAKSANQRFIRNLTAPPASSKSCLNSQSGISGSASVM